MSLVSNSGITLDDINGRTTKRVQRRQRRDLVARVQRALPWLDDPEPEKVVSVEHKPGLTEKEVFSYYVLQDEAARMEEERRKEEADQWQK